jgi:hypothetical protein
MCILKKGNNNMKRLTYTSLAHQILQYGVAYWDFYREGQINVLDWVQNRDPKFEHQKNDLNWKT